jgi:hypothetical protein
MANDTKEEDLLKSIEEVESRILSFRRRLRDVLADVQADSGQAAAGNAAD